MVCWTRTSHQSMVRGFRGEGRDLDPPPESRLFENGLELELASGRTVRLYDLEAGHRIAGRVAVLVETELPVDAFEVLGVRDRLADGLALLGDILGLVELGRGALDAVDGDPRGLRRVQGVPGRLL